ncbi:MAG: ATP phosphoribosyltransferase regulatory subunit [Hyphomicrobiaceae bacterium]
MAAETVRSFEALETQAGKITSVFINAGHEAVAPSQIQPAGIFLDAVGEMLRARTYVFQDPDGDELCLRPDLTVPTCRLHLERHEHPDTHAKYCYNGTAFRFQPEGATAAHPREFRQAGIETFGLGDAEKAEAETVALILEAVKSAGLKDFRLRIGDLGLFRAVLNTADMPERWRQRLFHQFWRPEAFRAELTRLTEAPESGAARLPEKLRKSLDPKNPRQAEQAVADYLDNEGIPLVGRRSVAEITEHLLTITSDAQTQPLKPETSELIENYISVAAPARAAGARLKDLIRDKDIDISQALDVYHRRLQLLTDAGVDVVHADFSAEFGRTLEYYTGFVFEVVVESLGETSPIAGGGRYDNLLKMCGAPENVPAIGAAIHTERLLSAVTGEPV